MKVKLLLAITVLTGFLLCSCGNAPNDEQEGGDEEKKDTTLIVKETLPSASAGHFEYRRNKNPHPQGYFRNPFDSAILLAGTFCELRNNHFHGGLDIRTGGWEGWHVKSAAKGYVSRIKVSPYGYGKALYITHPNGYTSVYGHLKEFTGAIADYVEKAQYKQRRYEVELFPLAKDLPVAKGQEVAISGNTGGSGGPHLHFELRDRSGKAVNPLLFGLEVEDHIPPQIKQVLVYHRDKEHYTVHGGYAMKKLKKESPQFRGAYLKLKPGAYAFGMLAKDFFTDTRNKLGINYCWMTANDQLLYQYQIERMDFTKGRYYNTHIDYYLKSRTGVNYVRLFKEPFNPYPYYKQNHNGEIYLKQNDTVRLQLYVEDYVGMRDSVAWTMVGDTNGQSLSWSAKFAAEKTVLVQKGKTNHLTFDPWKVSIPSQAFYHDFEMKMGSKAQRAGLLSPGFQMHYSYTPLHSYINVSYPVTAELEQYGDKLCAVSFNGDHKVYEGGAISNGRLHFKTRSFGEYAVYLDTVPPRIRVESVGRKFRFRVSDNLSGIKSYTASVDDQWVLTEYEPKLSLMFGRIPDWVKAGEHMFKFVVIDDRGNRRTYKRTIKL